MRSHALALLAAAGTVVGQSLKYTATASESVAAARATAKTSSPTSNVKGKVFDRLAIIWLENTDYDMALGDPNLKFLADRGLVLDNHFAVTHPSQPNYVAAIGGDYFGMNHDDFIGVDANVSSVVDLLEAKGISWGHYQEDMPYSGFEGKAYVNQKTGANDYVRKHNPAINYNRNTESLDRLSLIKNLTLFYEDLENQTLPQWMFITPNMTSDGHDSSVTVAGSWTRDFVEPLLDDERFMNNTLVLITFDENSTYAKQNRILAILLGDALPADRVGTKDANFYNHYSTIASVEANWGLRTLGRWDVGANVWDIVAEKSGDEIRTFDPDVLATRYWNYSYDGFFNDETRRETYPKPNLCIESNGRTVQPAIRKLWRASSNPGYYQDTIEVPDGYSPPEGFVPVY